MTGNGCDTMWFLPSALNVKVKKFNYARVNGRSIYDSFKLLPWKRNVTQQCGASRKQFRQHDQIAGKS